MGQTNTASGPTQTRLTGRAGARRTAPGLLNSLPDLLELSPRDHRTFTALSMYCFCGIATVFNTTCACVACSTCSTRPSTSFFTVLQLWNLYGILHRLHHWNMPLRQEKKFEDLVDELRLLNQHGLEHRLCHRHLSQHNERHVNNIVQDLLLWSLSTVVNLFSVSLFLCCTTGIGHRFVDGLRLWRQYCREKSCLGS